MTPVRHPGKGTAGIRPEPDRVAISWGDPQARDRYVKLITLELEVMKAASEGESAERALDELNALLERWFPKTKAFIESRASVPPGEGFTDELMFVAWVEARAASPGGSSRDEGGWSRSDIEADMADCFRQARRSAGL